MIPKFTKIGKLCLPIKRRHSINKSKKKKKNLYTVTSYEYKSAGHGRQELVRLIPKACLAYAFKMADSMAGITGPFCIRLFKH